MNPEAILDVFRGLVDLIRALGLEDQMRDHLNAAAAQRANAAADAAEDAKFGPAP